MARSQAAGVTSSLTAANVRLGRAICNQREAAGHKKYALLFDPQTAGGLLAGVAAADADAVVRALRQAGYADATVVGARAARRGAVRQPTLVSLRRARSPSAFRHRGRQPRTRGGGVRVAVVLRVAVNTVRIIHRRLLHYAFNSAANVRAAACMSGSLSRASASMAAYRRLYSSYCLSAPSRTPALQSVMA